MSALRAVHALKPVQILLVCQSPDGARLIQAFDELSVQVELHVAAGGEDAVDCLTGRGRHATRLTPNLVLLDLHAPAALETLRAIKFDPTIRRTPVVAFGTGIPDSEVLASYENLANSFVPMPGDPRLYPEFVRTLQRFWLELVELPSR